MDDVDLECLGRWCSLGFSMHSHSPNLSTLSSLEGSHCTHPTLKEMGVTGHFLERALPIHVILNSSIREIPKGFSIHFPISESEDTENTMFS